MVVQVGLGRKQDPISKISRGGGTGVVVGAAAFQNHQSRKGLEAGAPPRTKAAFRCLGKRSKRVSLGEFSLLIHNTREHLKQ
jgi:hypothetical protein